MKDERSDNRIVVSAWACFEAGRLLVVRPHRVPVWFLPGGLVEPGESLAEAAAREANEEVGVTISPEALQPWTVVSAPAHGRTDIIVDITVHVGDYTGAIEALDEIAEIGWVTASEREACADAIKLVIDRALADQFLSA